MNSRSVLLFLLEVISAPFTLAQLYPELVHSHFAPAFIDIDVKDTKFVKTKEPLTCFTPFTEVFDLNHTGQSIDVVRTKHHPVGLAGTLRGGVLGDDVYVHHKFKFYWNDNTTDTSNRLEVLVFKYNRKYGSYENALKHSDGLVLLLTKIHVFDATPSNPLYNVFDQVLKKIPKPGDHNFSPSSFTYYWFSFYPKHTVYYAYRSKYTDEDTGQPHPATVLVISPNPANNISYHQFISSFGKLKNCLGKLLVNIAPRCPRGDATVIRSEGLVVLNLPS